MKRINARGSLGDTYIIMLKVRCMGQRVIAYHHTKHIYWYGAISEIYNLWGNVEVRFVKEPRYDLDEITSNCHEGKMEFFPMMDIYDNFHLEKPYNIIQPHSGKFSGGNCKRIPEYMINEFISNSPIKCVLLGIDKSYSNIVGCINLMGKTSIRGTVSLIQNCNEFIGPEGLLSFIALSHKKPSTIYFTAIEAVEKRVMATPWMEYANLIQMV